MEERHMCADFRARRERMGLARADMSKALGVGDGAVPKWESPFASTNVSIPDRAWDWLKSEEAQFDAELREAVDAAKATAAMGIVMLPYPYDGDNRERAMSRLVGERLGYEGYEVIYHYPQEDE